MRLKPVQLAERHDRANTTWEKAGTDGLREWRPGLLFCLRRSDGHITLVCVGDTDL
jgi:hypothetical protein